MATKTKGKSAPKIPKLSRAEIFEQAKEYEAQHKVEGAAKKRKSEISTAVAYNIFERMKLKTLTERRSGMKITVVANSHMEYDERGLFRKLLPSKRRLVFNANVNLNALSPEARKRVIAALSKEELAEVTTFSLDVEKLSLAVQQGKIDPKVVAEYADEVHSKPYIVISHGGS